MSIDKSIAMVLKTGGLVMAAVFAVAITLGVMGIDSAVPVTQVGILCAIAVPVIGIIVVMVLLFKNFETKYGVCAIILLILLTFTVVWRMLV